VHLWHRFVRFAFHHFYNEFAWTYDPVSRVVSRGKWREWQMVALREVHGSRVLEIAFGTGNLLWELVKGGYQCVGIDRSSHMVAITDRKFRRRGRRAPICRARVEQLPFPDGAFDSLVSTFPDYFILDPVAQAEMARVLVPGGRLVVIEGGYLLKEDVWSRFLNWAFKITVSPRTWKEARELFKHALFSVERHEVNDGWSSVGVVIAEKRAQDSNQLDTRSSVAHQVL
jgi:ubiquinone/menaquinone biosynthesis C-methylase UbiE